MKEITQRGDIVLFIDEPTTSSAQAPPRGDRRRVDPLRRARGGARRQSALPRSTSTASTWSATPRSSAASSRSGWTNPRPRTPSRSSRACATATSSTTWPNHRRGSRGRGRAGDRYTGPLPAHKAIDLIDEAASRARIKSMTALPVYRDLEEEIETTRRTRRRRSRQEFEKAANLRDKERQLTNKKRELEEQWRSASPASVRRSARRSPTSSRCGRASRSSS